MIACPPLHALDLSGNVALTSDYVFRGISQSNEGPALQGGARIDTETGLYGSAWASRVDFPSSPAASAEVDYVVGVRRKLGVD